MKKILLIDDEEISIYLNRMIVKNTGVFEQIDTYSSGADALDLLRNLEKDSIPAPEMILLDMHMPEMNGFQFLDKYGELSDAFRKRTKIIMLTASIKPEEVQRAMAHKALADLCNKPLSKDKMKMLLDKFFPFADSTIRYD